MANGLSIATTGMMAESVRLDVVANNLANADTTSTPQGGPYQREEVVLQALPAATSGPDAGVGQGVEVAAIMPDAAPFQQVYDPTNPQANAQGYVLYPNVSLPVEMTDMIVASRAYQSDATAFTAEKTIDQQALNLGA